MSDLIRREDAIHILACVLYAEASQRGEDAKIEDYIPEAKAWMNDAPSADRPTGWIPVSDRLPDDKTYVLTTIHVNGRQPHARSGFYHGGFFHNDNGDTWKATDRPLKAWMPLPEPYKGGEDK